MSRALRVPVGDGAQMAVPSPGMDGEEHRWRLTHGQPSMEDRLVAVEMINAYAYLLSNDITTAEAIRRLRIMRRAFHAAFHGGTAP